MQDVGEGDVRALTDGERQQRLAFARVLQQPSFATLTPLADVAGRAA